MPATATNSATSYEFHEFYLVDINEKVNRAMTVYHAMELGAYGFNWFKCDDIDQVRELTGAGDIMAIEVTENGCNIFRG